MNCTKNISRGCCFTRNEEGEALALSTPGSHKMEVYDWLKNTPNPLANNKLIEVQFKNTRKSFYENGTGLDLVKGDVVVVESSPGVDVGIVSLTSDLVANQMKKQRFSPQDLEFKKIIRKAKSYDIEKWQEAIALEHSTMIRSRQISSDLGLKMKIGDVEYQGDRLKAIFYYIADDRVDFRELIKVLAEQFRIRVEMKQIGARQEAGRIGGISACGRQLCCSSWQNSFQSVSITAARHQEISLNPQKLAGQCGKLKCCLNYEVDNYIDARKEFPYLNAPLEAMDGTYHLVKSDIFKKVMWFSPDPHNMHIMIPVSIDRVRKIIAMNRKGVKIDKIEDETLIPNVVEEPTYLNVVGEESITRFDKSSAGANAKGNRNNRNRNNRNRNDKPAPNSDTQNTTERQPAQDAQTTGQERQSRQNVRPGRIDHPSQDGPNSPKPRNANRNEQSGQNNTADRPKRNENNNNQGAIEDQKAPQTQSGQNNRNSNGQKQSDRPRQPRNDRPRTENTPKPIPENGQNDSDSSPEDNSENRKQGNNRPNRFRPRKPKAQE